MAKRLRASSITLLPEQADRDVAWALDQVISRRSMTQAAALVELNARLERRGLPTASASSFSRLVKHYREHGIPERYRPEGAAVIPMAPALEALVGIIDQRIEQALQRRAGRQ